jgi:diguanylate cyclase (GGDEF)-like protein
MIGRDAGERARASIAVVLDDLEFNRNFAIDARLEQAIQVERQAAAAGAIELQMRARLVQADMLLRTGQAAGAHLAMEVNNWAREHGPQSLLARSHLVLSSVFDSIGDSASCLDHALRALELLDRDAPLRSRGNFLLRLADALAVASSFDAARQRYREAEQVFLTIGDVERQLAVLNNMAYSEHEAGDSQRAWEAVQEMRTRAEASGFGLSPPLLDTLARAYMTRGDYEQAEAELETGLGILETRGNVEADTPAGLMLTLAEVRLRQGRLEIAQETLEACRATCVERRLGAIEVEVTRVQAEIYAAAGRFDRAFETYKVFHSQALKLSSASREAAARTRHALFETAEARQEAQRFWRQARTDALTGLPNRRYVDDEIPRCLNAVATGRPLVVAIVDVDHFKRVNDSRSHEIGDVVLSELGQVLLEALAPGPDPAPVVSRFVARLGGEEFLVVLPGLDLAAATRELEAVCVAVATHTWSQPIGRLSLTVSIGATAARQLDTQSSLLARADHNLYGAKAAGRNRVVVDELSPVEPQLPTYTATLPTSGRKAQHRAPAVDVEPMRRHRDHDHAIVRRAGFLPPRQTSPLAHPE